MMIRNLVERQEFGYADYYKQEMFLISETLGMDRCWSALAKRLPKEHVMDKWDDATVRQMMEYSKKTKTGTLWILDDLITSEAMANKRGSLLQELFVMGRHYKCSLLLTSQKYRASLNQIFKPVGKRNYLPIWSSVDGSYFGDLIFYPKERKINAGFGTAMLLVECTTRKAYIEPMKNKTTKEVLRAFEVISKKLGQKRW